MNSANGTWPRARSLSVARFGGPDDSVDLEEGVTADLGETGHIIGLEVLETSARLTPDELGAVKYERLKRLLD